MSLKDERKHIGYGKLQYEYTDAKTIYDAPQKMTFGHLFADGYYLLFGAAMLVWYLYSAITHSIKYGAKQAFLSGGHLLYLVFLFTIELIVILSVFHKWLPFLRFTTRSKITHPQDSQINEIVADAERVKANKPRENALYIYTSYIVIKKYGIESVFSRSELRSVTAKKRGKHDLDLQFFLGSEINSYYITVPYDAIITLRKIFSEKLLEEEYHEIQTVGLEKESIGPICLGSLFILVGIFLIVARFTFMKDLKNVPLLMGIIFSLFGIFPIIMKFYHYPVVKHGFIPLFFGIIFFMLPFSIIYLIGQDMGTTVQTFFSTFNYNAVAVWLLSFSPMFFFSGLKEIVKCIHYCKK